MAILQTPKEKFALLISKKLGKGDEFGEIAFSDYYFGFYHEKFGIYKTIHYRKKTGISCIAKFKHYLPKNPKTTDQEANREKFKNAVQSWQSLEEEEKEEWREKAKKKNLNMSGYNLYISLYMLDKI